MSLVGTLGKIAVGVMVAKTATSVLKGARGGGGGGLGGMLGNCLLYTSPSPRDRG